MPNFADLFGGGVRTIKSTGLVDYLVVSAVPCVLYGFGGRNTDAGNGYYMMIFDAVALPADTADPIDIVAVPAALITAGNFKYDAPLVGISMLNGCVIAASSTDGVLTHTANNKLKIRAQIG